MGLFDFLKKKRKKQRVNPEKELKATIDFLKNSPSDIKQLSKLVNVVDTLRKSRQTNNDLKREIKEFDKLLKVYRFFQDDVDITGERIKRIARLLKKEAEENKLEQEWQNYIKNDENWNFDW